MRFNNTRKKSPVERRYSVNWIRTIWKLETKFIFLYYLGATQVHQSFRKRRWPLCWWKGCPGMAPQCCWRPEAGRAPSEGRTDGAPLVLCDSYRKEPIGERASERNWYLLKVKPAELMEPALNLTSGKDLSSWQLHSLHYVRGTWVSVQIAWRFERKPGWFRLG